MGSQVCGGEDGVARLARQYGHRLALAVVIGNEGINDNRYDLADLRAAADDLTHRLAAGDHLPVTTSEPAGDYGWAPLRAFGDFLAPNIHPALDRHDLAPDAAAAWVRRKALAIGRAADRPVLVKETGARTAERRRSVSKVSEGSGLPIPDRA